MIIKAVKMMFRRGINSLMRKRDYNRCLELLKRVNRLEGVSYSLNNEDLVIRNVLKRQKNGFYLDVGAHDPVRFSNTFQLYLNGWNGINIDPLPGCMKKFKQYRPGDINLNIGISSQSGTLDYYDFEEPAYNTTDKDRAQFCIDNEYSKLKEVISIKVVTMKRVLDKYAKGRKIDFMNLDVESRELDVLKSNDWDKYRPTLIAMESLASTDECIDKVYEDEAIMYLVDRGYKVVAKVGAEVFLKDWRE